MYQSVPVFFLFYTSAHNSLILCPKKLIFYSKCCSSNELSDGILSSYFLINLAEVSLPDFMHYF